MGRMHKDVVVVIGMDADGTKLVGDIVPRTSFNNSGSILLNSQPMRRRDGIRMISVRTFDANGARVETYMRYYGSDGEAREAFHRRPDGTIIDTEF
jgi:hypothetical protein